MKQISNYVLAIVALAVAIMPLPFLPRLPTAAIGMVIFVWAVIAILRTRSGPVEVAILAWIIAFAIVSLGVWSHAVNVTVGASARHHSITYQGVLEPRDADVGLTNATIVAHDVSNLEYSIWAVGQVTPWLLGVVLLLLLRPVLFTARSHDPFQPRNSSNLAAMGWLLLAGLPVLAVLQLVVTNMVADASLGGTPAGFPVESLVPGLTMLALARIFRQGVELRELEASTI